jgi:hypothetical protein
MKTGTQNRALLRAAVRTVTSDLLLRNGCEAQLHANRSLEPNMAVHRYCDGASWFQPKNYRLNEQFRPSNIQRLKYFNLPVVKTEDTSFGVRRVPFLT